MKHIIKRSAEKIRKHLSVRKFHFSSVSPVTPLCVEKFQDIFYTNFGNKEHKLMGCADAQHDSDARARPVFPVSIKNFCSLSVPLLASENGREGRRQ